MGKEKTVGYQLLYSDREPGAHNVSSRRDTDLFVNIADSEGKSSTGARNDNVPGGGYRLSESNVRKISDTTFPSVTIILFFKKENVTIQNHVPVFEEI